MESMFKLLTETHPLSVSQLLQNYGVNKPLSEQLLISSVVVFGLPFAEQLRYIAKQPAEVNNADGNPKLEKLQKGLGTAVGVLSIAQGLLAQKNGGAVAGAAKGAAPEAPANNEGNPGTVKPDNTKTYLIIAGVGLVVLIIGIIALKS